MAPSGEGRGLVLAQGPGGRFHEPQGLRSFDLGLVNPAETWPQGNANSLRSAASGHPQVRSQKVGRTGQVSVCEVTPPTMWTPPPRHGSEAAAGWGQRLLREPGWLLGSEPRGRAGRGLRGAELSAGRAAGARSGNGCSAGLRAPGAGKALSGLRAGPARDPAGARGRPFPPSLALG